MNDEVIADLQRQINDLSRSVARYRRGAITGVAPVDVDLGGSGISYEGVKQIHPGAVVGDQVAALSFGNDLLVLGRIVAGGVTTYTPTWSSSGTQPSIGNGTLTGRYERLGDLVWVTINLVAGGTTGFGTGVYNLSLPVAPLSGVRQALTGVLSDVGTQSYDIDALVNGSSNFEEILATSSTTGPTNWQAAVPFTFGSTDRITITGVYAVA